MSELRERAVGLRFPEGPVAMADGSIVLVEIMRGTLTRVHPDGRIELVAEVGGGPNGAAVGPDGRIYLCNNGGYFEWHEIEGFGIAPGRVENPPGGSIQAVDLDSAEVEVLYTDCDGIGLTAPNDLVFDADGGFWFTDHGVHEGDEAPAVLYARPDGTSVRPGIHGLDGPNGVGLSPDGSRLYVAETYRGRLWSFDLAGPGVVVPPSNGEPHGGTLLHQLPEGELFDSLAVDGEGWVNVGTLVNGGITCVAPDGSSAEHVPVPDPVVTNICFGGHDLRTAYITASAGGVLYETDWPRPGLRLAY